LRQHSSMNRRILLTIVMGMLKFGVYMSHSLSLTVAANAINRSMG
jgi:hypothetical protein